MKTVSFTHFLAEHAGVDKDVIVVLRDVIKGFWGVGYDALSALEGFRMGMPGTYHLDIGELSGEPLLSR